VVFTVCPSFFCRRFLVWAVASFFIAGQFHTLYTFLSFFTCRTSWSGRLTAPARFHTGNQRIFSPLSNLQTCTLPPPNTLPHSQSPTGRHHLSSPTGQISHRTGLPLRRLPKRRPWYHTSHSLLSSIALPVHESPRTQIPGSHRDALSQHIVIACVSISPFFLDLLHDKAC